MIMNMMMILKQRNPNLTSATGTFSSFAVDSMGSFTVVDGFTKQSSASSETLTDNSFQFTFVKICDHPKHAVITIITGLTQNQ